VTGGSTTFSGGLAGGEGAWASAGAGVCAWAANATVSRVTAHSVALHRASMSIGDGEVTSKYYSDRVIPVVNQRYAESPRFSTPTS